MMLSVSDGDWYYRCGQAQARADALGQELREAIEAFDRAVGERSESENNQVESAAVTTSAGISDSKIIYLIRQTPRLNKLFTKLSVEGKRRVLRLANHSDFLLAQTIEDVLEQERGN